MAEVDEAEKTRAMREVEERCGEEIQALLRRLYIEEGLSIRRIATRLELSESTVWNWLARMGIPTRQWRLPGEQQ